MINRSELGNIKNEAMISELACFVSGESILVEGCARHLETIEICRVELLESTDERLHVEFGINLIFADVGEANLDFVAEFSSFLLRF